MTIADAQREIRTHYLGGFAGQLVSGLLWLGSASLATWSTPRRAILLLVVGGLFIYPLTLLVLRATGRRLALAPGNTLRQLGMQVAFTLPLNLPVVAAAALYRLNWFYPAFMIVLGTHYLPFSFLYGMWPFAALSGLLVAGGVALALYVPGSFAAGGWLTGALLLAFAFAGPSLAARADRAAGEVPRTS